jgi:hypothetical protein
MEQQKTLKSEEIEKIRIMQELIKCDEMIMRMNGDNFLIYGWVKKKEDLLFQLDQLNEDQL